MPNLRSGPISAASIHFLIRERATPLLPEFQLQSETKVEPDLRLLNSRGRL